MFILVLFYFILFFDIYTTKLKNIEVILKTFFCRIIFQFGPYFLILLRQQGNYLNNFFLWFIWQLNNKVKLLLFEVFSVHHVYPWLFLVLSPNCW